MFNEISTLLFKRQKKNPVILLKGLNKDLDLILYQMIYYMKTSVKILKYRTIIRLRI